MLDQAATFRGESHQANSTGKTRCFHCLQVIPKYTNIVSIVDGVQRRFCCHGCEAVATYIGDSDLGAFYQRRELASDETVVRSDQEKGAVDWSFLDDDELAAGYIAVTDDGSREFTVSLQGVYCQSCGWLIQHALRRLSDHIDLHLDISNKQLFIRLRDTSISATTVLGTIHRLGYTPDVIALDMLWHSPEGQHKQANRAALRRIVVAGFGMMQVMTYAVGLYFGDAQGIDPQAHRFLSLISMLVATVVVFYSGRPFFANAWQDLRRHQLGMDVPIALAIAGAYFPSVYQTLNHIPGHIFFDSAVMFIFFLSVGRFLEMKAQHRFSAAPVAISRLLPHFVSVHRNDFGTIRISPQEVRVGDCLTLGHTETVPFDAQIIHGTVMIDEVIITGESEPVCRTTGERVVAGTLIIQGEIEISAVARWSDSSLAKIQQLLQRAQARAVVGTESMQQVTRHFVLALLLITTAVACTWWFIAPERIFHIVLAMLVASCPCAFSLAAPIANSAASFSLRKNGLLLGNMQALSTLTRVTHWCLDKTGTLTRGRPKISHVQPLGTATADACVAIASAMERDQQHVLSGAFNDETITETAGDIEVVIGAGISATVAGKRYFLGKESWVKERLGTPNACRQTLRSNSNHPSSTVVLLASEQDFLARFYLQDELRAHAAEMLNTLSRAGCPVSVLSGDKSVTVKAQTTGLNVSESLGDLQAFDKQAYVQQLQEGGAVVAMVGDGINDAPVIRQADVSIAMASGSELSHSQADVIMLGTSLRGLQTLRLIARQTKQITRQNRRWAVFYNAIALPLAACGLLTPWLAALGMSLSSLLVVLNALRIGRTTVDAELVA
ncbi:MAG: heavy metal translocating P-type ATPase [Pseudomonadota bacterium]